MNKNKINIDRLLNISLCILAILFIMLFIKVPYYIYKTGGVLDLKNKIDVKDYECSGEYDMVYVSELNANVFTYLISLIHPEIDAIKIPENNLDSDSSDKEIKYRGKIFLDNSNSIATYYAYKLANKPLEITKKKFIVIYVDKSSKSNIEVNDEIISINGTTIYEREDINRVLEKIKIGQTFNIKVKNKGKKYNREVILNDEGKVGIMISSNYKFKNNIKFKFDDDETGPSGGMMMTLALYDYLNDYDLAKGRIIAGTGTIEEDGSIGEIDGVKYKLKAAINNKADLFLVSKYNYDEAMKIKKKNNYKIEIVKVETIEDAINYLKK